jgi:acyl dehydratase
VPINPDAVGLTHDRGQASWTSTDALLYAVGVGAGAEDPAAELAFTTENSHDVGQRVLPTFAVVIGATGREPQSRPDNPFAEVGDFSLAQILHGSQKIVLHGALPVNGTVTSTGRISGIYDKGENAVIETTSQVRAADTGQVLVESVSSIVVRGEGGFGGERGATAAWQAPQREPDVTVRYPTRPDQALLYRLSGDRNPLHSDPWFAGKAGLDRPILHGLCTYGFAGRALLHEVCGGDPEVFGSMECRFASVVYPGDVLDVAIWRTDEGALFQTRVGDRVVLDRGTFALRSA